MVLIPTFRLPTLIHTRSAQRQVAQRDRAHATRSGSTRGRRAASASRTGDLVRVEHRDRLLRGQGVGDRGHPARASSRCCHHMGRWRLARAATGSAAGDRRLVDLQHGPGRAVACCRLRGVRPVRSRPIRTPSRIWWTDAGVHQNLTFPVHPDPISGMHCWHQAVRVRPRGPATVRRHRRRHRQGARRLPGVAGADAPGRPRVARRHAAAVLADAAAQARGAFALPGGPAAGGFAPGGVE